MYKNLVIKQGNTLVQVVRWETPVQVFKAISGITRAAPAVVTCAGHGVPDGWRVAIVSVAGMRQINASNTPPRGNDFKPATVVDSNTLSLNSVNASEYSAYTSGGYILYRQPKNLTGYTARMYIKDRIGGTTLETLTTENGKIAIDATACTITLTLSAAATAAYTWRTGVYDLEMVSGSGAVTSILDGGITVTQEVSV